MANYRIKNSEFVEQPGQPDLFFEDDDFAQIVSNREDREALETQCGHVISVGPLGVLTDGGYVDTERDLTLPKDEERRGDLSYHESVQ